MNEKKRKIREFAMDLGVDDVGVALATDLPGTSRISEMLPDARSILVMVLKETSSCHTDDPMAAMNGRLDGASFIRHCSYRIARFMEKNWDAKAITIPYAFPMALGAAPRPMGIVSLRHAAVAAGLGTLGRHNLFIHPEMGSRVILFGVVTDLELPPDPLYATDLCVNCDICVENCPSHALDEPGKTDVARCASVSQPTGMAANAKFWARVLAQPPDAQKKMLYSGEYFNLLQTLHMGTQYFCFSCQKSCPVGK
ncbi:4Fe-4S binding protein [Desulfosarcina sp. OttesenSCG-928-G10]|nr:4Fe-4S binding protein [Desulfosarcina sp. OttesenSCG-928-G10]